MWCSAVPEGKRHSCVSVGNQLLRGGPSYPVSTGAGVGSSAVATVIGSSLAPLGACPLVSMATPALSKHEGASFYELIKPNFAALRVFTAGVWGNTQTPDQAL